MVGTYKALTFDCYGTLIDWEQGILKVLRPWATLHSLDLSDDDLLRAFADVETKIQTGNPGLSYTSVLEEVARRIEINFNVSVDSSFHTKLAHSISMWPAFSDTSAGLKQLAAEYKLIVLSNIDEEAFEKTNANQLQIPFFKVLTAEKIGTYKPDLNNFRYLITSLGKNGIEQHEILHVAQSLYHDIEPAHDIGLTTCWIDRHSGRKGFGATPPPKTAVIPDYTFRTVGDLAEFLCA